MKSELFLRHVSISHNYSRESGGRAGAQERKKGNEKRCRTIGWGSETGQTKGILKRKKIWWTRRGSNPRPPHCERGALPAELLAHFDTGNAYSTIFNSMKSREKYLRSVPCLLSAAYYAISFRELACSRECACYYGLRPYITFAILNFQISNCGRKPRYAVCCLLALKLLTSALSWLIVCTLPYRSAARSLRGRP